MANDYKIFKCLDDPMRFLFWKIDEFFILFGSLLISAIFNSFSLFFIGVAMLLAWRKAKKKMGNFNWKLLVYWHLGIIFKKKVKRKIIPSFIRKLRG